MKYLFFILFTVVAFYACNLELEDSNYADNIAGTYRFGEEDITNTLETEFNNFSSGVIKVIEVGENLVDIIVEFDIAIDNHEYLDIEVSDAGRNIGLEKDYTNANFDGVLIDSTLSLLMTYHTQEWIDYQAVLE